MPTATDVSARRTERLGLLVATLSSFLTPFMGASANVALPSIGRELALDAVALSWVASSFLLAAAVALVPFGQLADIHGRKRIFTWGIGVYTLGSALSALSPSAAPLIAARSVQGLGGAMIFGTGVAILTSIFPAGRRGWALGVNVSSVYLGLALGPVIGGLVTEHYGWRVLFGINAGLGVALVAIVVSFLEGEWAGPRGTRFDLAGSALYAIALGALMFGLSRAQTAAGGAWTAGGLALLAAFLRYERGNDSPVLDVRLFTRSRVYAMSNLAALINYSATFAVGFLLSLYLQHVRALGPQAAGLVLVAQPILMATVSPFAGRLSDKVESRIVASAGMALTALGLALLAGISSVTPLAYVVGCLTLLGMGFGLFSSPNTNAVMGAVEPRQYGAAAATLGTMRLGGQMLSMGLAMLVMSVTMGAGAITPARHGGLVLATRLTFGLFAALCVAGVFASAARGNVRGVHAPR
jgi:EmrB/QacA subfamily drug resistance transporter